LQLDADVGVKVNCSAFSDSFLSKSDGNMKYLERIAYNLRK